VEIGYNERLDGLQAALLRVKLPHLDGWNHKRREHASLYRDLLPREVRIAAETPDSPSIYHLFATLFENRDQVAAALKARGVETGVHYAPAIPGHAAWGNLPLMHGSLPAAEMWAAQELSLPMHPDLTRDEIARVADAVHTAVYERIA
jgi:dTDP-4-amino-4,6-dideoxygalactose transaminase